MNFWRRLVVNKKERQAILKILLIREELSEKEFSNVIHYLSEEISGSDVVEKIVKKEFLGKKQSKVTTISLINDIKSTHPEKYELLSELYRATQDGTVFKGMPEIKLFLERAKIYPAKGKAKSEQIHHIFQYLVKLSYDDLNEVIKKIEYSCLDNDDSYRNLSNFIIQSPGRIERK